MSEASLLAFVPLAALLTLTPGADTLLVVKNVLGRGPASGLVAALGICSGLFVHAAASALGLSVVLARSAEAYHLFKLAGAAYLVWLGLSALRRCWKDAGRVEDAPAARPASRLASFREGFFSNVLNPKAAVFYLSILPHFIAPGDDVLAASCALAAIHGAMALLWLGALSLFLDRMGAWVSGPRFRRRMEAVSGGILALLGIGLALEDA
ncbi:MAG: LysE family translocator [Desulfovibrionaceae bacterium]